MANSEKTDKQMTEIELVPGGIRRASISSSINSSTASVKRRLAFLWRCCKCCFCVPSKCCRCCCCHKNLCCGCCCHEYYHRKTQTDDFGSGSVYLKAESTPTPLENGKAVCGKPNEDIWCLIVSNCISPMWQKDANDLGMEKFLSKYSDVVLKPKSQVPEPMSMPYDEIERLLNADKNQKKEKDIQVVLENLESKLSDKPLSSEPTEVNENSLLPKEQNTVESKRFELPRNTKVKNTVVAETNAAPASPEEPLSASSNRNSRLLRKEFFGLADSDEEEYDEDITKSEVTKTEQPLTPQELQDILSMVPDDPAFKKSSLEETFKKAVNSPVEVLKITEMRDDSPSKAAEQKEAEPEKISKIPSQERVAPRASEPAESEDEEESEEESGEEDEETDDDDEEESETITTKKITRIIRVDPNGERKEFVYEGSEVADTEKLIEKALADLPNGAGEKAEQLEPVVKTRRRVVLKKEVVKRTVIQDGEPPETTVETKQEQYSDSGPSTISNTTTSNGTVVTGESGDTDVMDALNAEDEQLIKKLEQEFAEL